MVARLIAKGLMFGNLVHVASPVLVERYNRALRHLTGGTTALTDFHIDISGYAPEIGAELGDDLYLNHAGVNRQFILLTNEQKTAPLLNATFSTARGILRQFITANEPQLFALTARDAVAGELVNSVFRVDRPSQLLDIRRITIEADTTDGTIATAARLGAMIDRFKTVPDAWFDDVLIGEMIGLAGQTGDVTRHPVALTDMTFAQDNFWTSLFGGLYLFRGTRKPLAIAAGPKDKLGDLPGVTLVDLRDRAAIAGFLQEEGLVETIIGARGAHAAAIIHQKMDFIVAGLAADAGQVLGDLQDAAAVRRGLRAWARLRVVDLPPEWHSLAALARWAESGGEWPRITSDHPGYFYTLRAAPHADADLVNRLLAELAPLDIRQLFICHKEAFYEAYTGWSEARKDYVATILEREYLLDKAGTRATLFGHDAPLAEPEPQPRDTDMIAAVGPWGAVRRR